MWSSKAAAFRVEALLKISTEEVEKGPANRSSKESGRSSGASESANGQRKEVGEKMPYVTNHLHPSDSEISSERPPARLSSKRTGGEIEEVESNGRIYKKPRCEEHLTYPSPTSRTCREQHFDYIGNKYDTRDPTRVESGYLPIQNISTNIHIKDSLATDHINYLNSGSLTIQNYTSSKRNQIPLEYRLPETNRLEESSNAERSGINIIASTNLSRDLSLKGFESRDKDVRSESSPFRPGFSLPEAFDLRWAHQRDYYHLRFGQRMVRSLPATPSANESTFRTKELNHLVLTPQSERGIERCSENQRTLTQDGISVALQHQGLWVQFHQHQTEMIITKNGRRMFPVIKIRVFGLNPDALYMIYLDMDSIDGRRYRYAYPSSTWVVAGTGDINGQDQAYMHPDSPASGTQWMEMLTISFDKLKLTNNRNRDTTGQVFLYSMQKYRPRLWIQCLGTAPNHEQSEKLSYDVDLQKLVDRNHSIHFSFPETSFITVTAYQNQRITRLKINSNPFAKGFRDNSKFKEVMERQLVSPNYGLDCAHGSFRCLPGRLPPSYFASPFPFSPVVPFSPAIPLRPVAPLNRWLPCNPPVKPSDAILSPIAPFIHPMIKPIGLDDDESHHPLNSLLKRNDT